MSVKTCVWSYNLYTTYFLSFPSHLTLVTLIKLTSTQIVCTEKERKKEREKERKDEGKHSSEKKKYPGLGCPVTRSGDGVPI
jgi:hypothetical protein